MASRTQLRLGQITGSFGDAEGKIVDNLPTAATLAAIPAGSGSLVSAISQLASAVQRINGGAAFTSQAAGEFNHNLAIKGTTPKLTIGDAGEEDTMLVFDGNTVDFRIGLDDGTDKLEIGLGASHGATANMILNSANRDVAFQGDIEVLGGKVSLTNGSQIDSETAGTLLLTEDLVKTSANLVVGGNEIKASDGTTAITLSGNDVTIAGDLTVSGDTVQVDVAKLTVEDPLIELARSNGGDTLDIGFVGRYNNGSNNVYAGLFRDQNDSGNFHLFKDTQEDLTAATTINRAATGYAKASLIVDTLDADGGVTIDNITIDGTEIDLSSGDLTLDVEGNIKLNANGNEWFFEDHNTQRGIITSMDPGSGEMLILSSSTSHNLALMSRAGTVMLSDGTGAVATSFDFGTASTVKIKDSSDRQRLEFYSPDGEEGRTRLSGSFHIHNGAQVGQLVMSGTNTQAITLDVPASPTAYTLTLPAANGSAAQYLRLADGNGNLMFSNAESNTVSKRQIGIIAALASGSALNPNSATASNAAPYTRAALDLGSVDNYENLINVFVNGQLLVSGTDGNVGGGVADYTFVDVSATSTLKFGFALEVDDVVIVDVK